MRPKTFYSLITLASLSATWLPASAELDLAGIWMLQGPGTESEYLPTARASAIQAEYDLLSDDPSLYCVPSSASRVWANPNVRIAFEQSDQFLNISYEFFDLRRAIPFGDPSQISEEPSTQNISGTLFPEMGSSVAFYEGQTLVIESRNHAPGYIRTSRGIPQSENTVTREELTMEDGLLHITHTYVDESLFEAPFVLTYSFRRIEGDEVPLYECTDADYDWFNELNADQGN